MTGPFPPTVPYELPEPIEPAPPPAPEVWGGWATFGFGLVILVVTLIVQVVIGAILLTAYVVAEQVTFTSIDAFWDLFRENAGIILGVSVVANAVIGIGLMYLIIRGRRGLGFWGDLGFRRASPKGPGR